MKTDTLIAMLARGAGAAPARLAARRLGPAPVAGALASAALALLVLGPIPATLLATPAPWIKLGYAIGLALAAGWLSARLATPSARVTRPRAAVIGVIVGMVLAGLAALLAAPEAERTTLLLGHSWHRCPTAVLLLSLPALGATLWALRGLAPTRLPQAGFAAGLLAGASGAIGYALACTETSTAFVAIWYTLGIGLTGALGALIGPRVLRW